MNARFVGILILIVALVAAFYFSRAGGLNPLANLHLFSNNSTTTENDTLVGPDIFGPGPEGNNSQTETAMINEADIPTGFTKSQISPYFHKVRLDYIDAGSFDEPMSLGIGADLSDTERLDITNWKIQGNRGTYIIPRAVNIYEPTGLSGEADIILKTGHRVNINATVSPLGKNIRVNTCMGYLENHIDFNPGLNIGCPDRNLNGLSQLSGQCQSYLESLGSCEEPGNNPPLAANDYTCRTYLDKLNYRGCYDSHRTDSDFLVSEWRIWMGQNNNFLDFEHDRVLLLDTKGLLVDIYTY